MSSGETIYSVRTAFPDFLVRARSQVVSLELYRNGALFAPTQTGSTFALYYGDMVVVAPTAVTVTGSIATYSIPSASLPATLTLGRGYREEWSLVLTGETDPRVFRREASIVRHAAYPVITDADLLAVYSDLDRQRASTVTSFQSYIDEAWKRIVGRLEAQGIFPEHIVTSASLREVHAELTLHLICLDCARAQGGRWLELAPMHKKEFEMAWGRLRFVKDVDGNGADSDDLQPANKGVTFVNASPRTNWRGFGGL